LDFGFRPSNGPAAAPIGINAGGESGPIPSPTRRIVPWALNRAKGIKH